MLLMYYVMELLVAFTFPKPPVDNKSRCDDTNNFQLPLNLYQKRKAPKPTGQITKHIQCYAKNVDHPNEVNMKSLIESKL